MPSTRNLVAPFQSRNYIIDLAIRPQMSKKREKKENA